MRGVNISSVLLLLTLACNLSGIIYSKYWYPDTKRRKNAGLKVFIYFVINMALIAGIVYSSTVLGVTGYTVKSDRIPKEFDGYKILQISDFHTGTFFGGTRELVEEVKKEKPDIIVITGDLVDEGGVDLRPVRELLVELVVIAPVYFVSGNHDVWYEDFEGFQKYLVSQGVKLLDNKKILLQRGNAGITFAGIGDPDTWNDQDAELYLRVQIKKLKPENTAYNILLFHRANMFDNLKGKGFQLVLSGHMHGGQIQIPFVGGLISPHQNRRWFPGYTDGKWTSKGTTIIISRGLGNNAPVPRMLNPPELVAVTLKSVN